MICGKMGGEGKNGGGRRREDGRNREERWERGRGERDSGREDSGQMILGLARTRLHFILSLSFFPLLSFSFSLSSLSLFSPFHP